MKCIYVKDDGEKCNANAISDSEYCYFHDPDIPKEEKQLAQTRGGEARSLTLITPLPEMRLETPADAVMLVADTIKRVRAGELDIRTANSIGFLTDKLLKAFEVARLNDKVDFIERVVLERRTQ
jgi:hypothetical protein